jgi:integrase
MIFGFLKVQNNPVRYGEFYRKKIAKWGDIMTKNIVLHTVSGRERLKPRSEPYWIPLTRGCHLGYRVNAGEGTWVARYTHKGSVAKKRQAKSLGSLGYLPGKDQYGEAKRLAEAWFDHIRLGGKSKSGTLAAACESYASFIAKTKGSKAAHDITRRLNQYVLNDEKFANTELQNLSPYIIKQWRESLADMPIRAGKNKGKLRSAETLNRDMTCLRACLNFALEEGLLTSDMAWRKALKPVTRKESAEVGRQREVYLSSTERKALLKALETIEPTLVPLVTSMCLLPLRPGACAKLTVRDFDGKRLCVRSDKAHAGRVLFLPGPTAEFFRTHCQNKLPSAPIFSRVDGSIWDKDSWKKPIRKAATAAKLPTDTVAYTLRHSVITDLVDAGVPVTQIALLSGTSVRIIERNYAKLTSEMSVRALEALVNE